MRRRVRRGGGPSAGSEEPDYTTLLARVRAGEPAAIDDLLHRALRVARRYGLAVCGSAPDSDDAVQEALLRTFRHAGGIREPRAFRAWLYRTVKNACLVGRRRGAGEPSHLEPLDAVESGAVRDHLPGAEDVLASAEARAVVWRALDRLSPSHREAVFLRDLEGLSTREVAQVLGITEANVKVRLHRAHQQLRRALSGAAATSRSAHTWPSHRRRSL